MVQSLGFAIYRALDWGLDDSEERELSPQLERLIDLMANNDCEDGVCGAADEGYGGPEEEEEAEGGPRAVRTFAQAMRLCAARLTDPRGAQTHYQAVCRALFVETLELRAFLARVREAKEVRAGPRRGGAAGGGGAAEGAGLPGSRGGRGGAGPPGRRARGGVGGRDPRGRGGGPQGTSRRSFLPAPRLRASVCPSVAPAGRGVLRSGSDPPRPAVALGRALSRCAGFPGPGAGFCTGRN